MINCNELQNKINDNKSCEKLTCKNNSDMENNKTIKYEINIYNNDKNINIINSDRTHYNNQVKN